MTRIILVPFALWMQEPLAIAYGHVTGFPVYAPLCVLGLFVIEYARVAKWKN